MSLSLLEERRTSRTPPLIAVEMHEDAEAWNRYVTETPTATFYHRYEWLDLIRRVFGHRVVPLAARIDGAVAGVLPLVLMESRLFGRFVVSVPFVNYGGLLATHAEVERALWDRAVALAKEQQAQHLEARHLTSHPFIGQAKHHKVTMILSLAKTAEAQWTAFNAKLRNQIRKAEASGLTVTSGGAELVSTFYDVFARNMRDLGTPVYSRDFFADVLATFPDACRIFVVRQGALVVATGIALRHRESMEVPWAASRRDALSWCPNQKLYWAIIQEAIKAGCRRFDFGRSTPGSGPYRFKQQWGAQDVPLCWEYWTTDGRLPNLTPANPRYALAVRLWKRLPLGLTNRLGPVIVRNIP